MALEKIKPFIVDGTQDFVFGNATITGNITSNNANLGNLAVANFFSGTLTTGNQPNITTVGTLGNLSVTSNVSAGNIKTNNLLYANGSPWAIGTTTTVSGSNSQVQFNDSSSFGASANFTFDKTSNTLTVTNLVTNGSGITNITGSSVTGQVANALIAATVYTNAQPNITSVGTLSSLTVTGNITSGNANLGNTATANYFVGSGNNLSNIQGTSITGAVSYATTANSVAGSNVSGAVTYAATANAVAGANVLGQVANSIVAGTVYTSAQPNITSTGTLTELTVTGNTTLSGANVTLGAVANLHITGGTNGYVLQTDGSGTLSWVAQTGGGGVTTVSNGNSNVNIPSANGNINLSAVGNANVVVITGTGANITGTLNVSGNATLGNISTSGSGGNITGANVVSANTFTATTGLTSNGVVNFTNASNVALGAVGNVHITGGTVGQYLQTDGSGTLSWATVSSGSGSNISNGNSNVNISSANGNVNISAVGNANVLVVTGTGANITGTLNVSGTATLGNISTSGSGGNITGANVVSANTFTASANITAGNANLGNAVISNYFIGSLYGTANLATYATTANAVAGANVTGNVGNALNAYAVAGANVSGQVGNALIAGTVYTNAQPNITSVGTLSSLAVTGDISGANLVLSGNLTVTGTTTTVNSTTARIVDPIVEQGGGANGAALSSNDSKDRGTLLHYYTGSSATDAFMGWDNSNAEFAFGSNVSVTSEVVTFNSLGNVRANFFIGNGSQLTGLTAISAGYIANGNSNVTIPSANGNVNISATGVANVLVVTGTGVNVAGTLNTGSGVITGNGSGLSAIAGANVTGAVAYATTANSVAGGNVSGQVANALIAGTVYTNAQPNITSVGTLTSLGVNGTVTAVAFTANTGVFTGNGNGLSSIVGANVTGTVSSATTAGTVTTAAQPNITSVGTLSSLAVTGNITSGNANLGNAAVANFFTGSGAFLTSVTAVTAATVTTNAQPNITSVGTLTTLIVGNATANSTFGNGTITSTGNISFTGANVSLGAVGNLKITGGTAGYFLSTDGAGNLSWGAASGGGGVSATGSNTQIQFNDAGSLGASANLTFDKATNVFTTARIVASNGANLGSNVANVYIGGGSNNQILKTDGSGNLSWIAQPATTITVDNFTGDGTTVAFTLTVSPTSINQTVVNYNGTLQLRAAYTVVGTTLTFSEAPVNGSLIEVTTTLGVMSGSGAFVTRSYTGNGVQSTFSVTSGCTVSSVIVTENGLVQIPTVDYTISGGTLTFTTTPANGIIINIRELAIATATGGGSAITVQDEGSNLTTTASLLNFVGAGVTSTNSGSNVTVTIPSGGTSAAVAFGYSLVFGG